MSSTPPGATRQSGAFSPPSPPYYLVKGTDQTKTAPVAPQTPTSPPYMSSSSQRYASTTTSTQQSASTPPSSVVPNPQQLTSQSTNALPPTMSTPTGDGAFLERDQDGDAVMSSHSIEEPVRDSQDEFTMNINHGEHHAQSHMRTDHDRDTKRLRLSYKDRNSTSFGDHDMFPLYRLGLNPLSIPRAQTTTNLISTLGLDAIAASVARRDESGAKINKLRKSYEGIVKNLGLAGKNKAVAVRDELTHLVTFPDEEWYNTAVYGKDVKNGLPESITAKVKRATQMEPGRLPADENHKWRETLGLEEIPATRQAQGKPIHKPVARPMNQLLKTATAPRRSAVSSPAPRATTPLSELRRPQRSGAKRAYDEDSYIGYAEGFPDDASDAGFGDGSGGKLARKKRKTQEFATPGTPRMPPERGGNVSGMVTVSNGR